jgi:hypothetical protein
MSRPKPKRSRSKPGSRLEAITAAVAGLTTKCNATIVELPQRPADPHGLPRGRRLPPLRRRSRPSASAPRGSRSEADAVCGRDYHRSEQEAVRRAGVLAGC